MTDDGAQTRGPGVAVARVAGLWRFPVKSLAGEALESAEVAWHGVLGDRRWALVRGDVRGSGFPWLTLRQRPDLGRYHPSFVEPDQPDKSRVVVRTPAGATLDILDPAFAVEFGEQVFAMKQDRGVFDVMPLSVLTTGSVAWLSDALGRVVEPERFRPNIILTALAGPACVEDTWVGRTLTIGTLQIRIDQRDARCAVVNIAPGDGVRDPSVLRVIAQSRQGCLGVYGSVVRPGRLQVGDTAWLDAEG
ncbi:MAG: MOSC domain-containing protein [Nannocystaceae bacterium]|nr:MOSC domain-containing protein [Nannocystaceae bacterium]